jgi:hypothetical protein
MRLLAGTGASLMVVLASTAAHAVEDDLPVGDEPPRIVPVLVADTYYGFHDSAPSNRTATLMTTGSRHNEIAVNLLAIGARVQHAKLTGTVVAHFGSSVDALYASPNNSLSSLREVWKHIQLANVGWKTGDFHLEAGVLPSNVGREGFVSTENWNYTRAIIADSTPYFVTGLRATWRLLPTFSAQATAFNGWDTHGDRNSNKSGMLRFVWEPSDKLAVTNTFVAGVEQTVIEGEKSPIRLFDILNASYELHKRVSVAVEGWFGNEQRYNVEDRRKGTPAVKHIVKDPSYFGGALWAKWQFASTTYVAVRGEAVNDPAGVITGRGGRFEEDPILGQRLFAGTLTLGWKPHPNMLTRLEAVHRTSDNRFYSGGEKLTYEETLGESGTVARFPSEARKSSTTFLISAAFAY